MAGSSKKTRRPAIKARAQIPAPEAAAPEPEIAESPAPQAVEAFAPEVFAASAPEAVAPQAHQPPEAETAPAVEAPLATPEAVQKTADVVEDRTKFTQAKTAAAEATAAVEASFGAARDGVIALNVKAIEAIKAEADANLDMLASLAGAKSISEVIALQSEFARQRFEHAAARAKDLAELMRKVADETTAPIKAHVAKTFKVAV